MRSVNQLLDELRGLGVKVWVEADRLRYRAPKGTMTEMLANELRRHKTELMARLEQTYGSEIQRIEDRNDYELSHAQRRLWVLSQLGDASVAYNVGLRLLLQGKLDERACETALRCLIERHESLRTSFPVVGGQPRQRVHRDFDFQLHRVDVSSDPRPEGRALQVAQQDAATAFDLQNSPPLRATLIRLSAQQHVLLLTLHHIVTDGWSNNIIVREFAACYQAACRGQPADLARLRFQYRDFSAWQNRELVGSSMAVHRNYWRQKFAGPIPALDLPTDFPRPAVQTYGGSALSFQLGSRRARLLAEFTRRQNASLFMVLLAALKVLLYRYTGQEDVIVGAAIAGQPLAGAEDQVGCYVNTLAFRDRVEGQLPFVALLQNVKRTATEAYEHQVYPFDRLVEDLNLTRDVSRSPLVDVMLILQSVDRSEPALGDLRVRSFFQQQDTTVLDLVIDAEAIEDDLHFTIGYNTSLFAADTIARLGGHFQELFDSILADPATPVGRLNLLSDDERRRLVGGFHTAAEYPQDETAVHLIDRQTARTPAAVAVEDGIEQWTYRDLQFHSDRIARQLRGLGVGTDHLVGICVERSCAMLAGLLGIWKAGAAYVPLDPGFPRRRLAMILEDGRPEVLVTQRSFRDRLPDHQAQVLDLDDLVPPHSQLPATGPRDAKEFPSRPEGRAYVIYTSGSTGRPKGVEIPHRALVNFLVSMARRPGLGPDDVLLAVTTISFDISALELFLPLTCGARVVIASRDSAADGRRLIELLTNSKATVMQATPATWRMLLAAGWNPREPVKILCGGEGLSRELAGRLRRRGRAIWNLYGPTETTVWSTVCDVTADTTVARRTAGDSAGDPGPPRQEAVESIGQPIANTQVYVLDQWLQPQPIGVPGELYIGGDGLARGYFERPDLTAKRFIPHPFCDDPHARIYRTGDLVRLQPDGNLAFLGRIDQQVKIRGCRIELEEIETVLNRHRSVDQAVVVAEWEATGDRCLVAWYMPRIGHEVLVPQLRELARQTLPEYMVPSLFQKIDQLPLTPNGKVDRRALPASDRGRAEPVAEYVAPRSETEQRVAQLWRDVLEVERVGIYDNFFELGGHSLKATLLAARMQQELNVQLSLLDIFRHPTIADLAESIAGHQASPSVGIRPLAEQPPSASDEIAPLSAEELEMLNE